MRWTYAVAAIVLSGATGSAALAEVLDLAYSDSENVTVSAVDEPVDALLEILGEQGGFELLIKTPGECGSFSGQVSGSIGSVLDRLLGDCSFMLQTRKEGEAVSQISRLVVFRGAGGASRNAGSVQARTPRSDARSVLVTPNTNQSLRGRIINAPGTPGAVQEQRNLENLRQRLRQRQEGAVN